MEVEEITIPKDEAKEQLEALKEAFKENYKLKKVEIYNDCYDFDFESNESP